MSTKAYYPISEIGAGKVGFSVTAPSLNNRTLESFSRPNVSPSLIFISVTIVPGEFFANS